MQNLENFTSMAIQGTQVPMYTKHIKFLYFSDLSKFLFLIFLKNKAKLKTNKQKHVNKTYHKTRLTKK